MCTYKLVYSWLHLIFPNLIFIIFFLKASCFCGFCLIFRTFAVFSLLQYHILHSHLVYCSLFVVYLMTLSSFTFCNFYIIGLEHNLSEFWTESFRRYEMVKMHIFSINTLTYAALLQLCFGRTWYHQYYWHCLEISFIIANTITT